MLRKIDDERGARSIEERHSVCHGTFRLSFTFTEDRRMSVKLPVDGTGRASPITGQSARVIQEYGHVVQMPLGLSREARTENAGGLNQLLADTITLHDLYKKHHWQVSGATFYQLHLLFDKHAGEQAAIIDLIAERVMLLGGVAVAMSHDVAEITTIPRPPRGREEPPAQLSRLLQAHELILMLARALAKQAAKYGDDGTNDMLVSDIIRLNELQVWFLAEHLVDSPLVLASDGVS